MQFSSLGLDERLMDGISSMGYETATPVQAQVMQPILEGRDIIASAQTGTGKTAAFLLPIIHKLLTIPHDAHQINALIIVPTRELAIQIAETMEGLGYFTDVSCIAVYGGGDGTSFVTEKKALSSGVDMVVCTPGRMISHLNMGYVKMSDVRYLVLDEADRMLDMGFHDDIMKIIGYLPKQRQNLLFSATMPPRMRDLARKLLHNPLEISIAISRPPEAIVQKAFVVFEPQKMPLIKHLLQEKDYTRVIVFCSKKQAVKQLAAALKKARFSVEEIHSDLDQTMREQVLQDYRNKRTKILVATDVLSRGIDIEDIELVINYDVPHDGEDYVHRIGRTARAAGTGSAYTLVSEMEQRNFARIEELIDKTVEKAAVPAELGPVPAYAPQQRRSKPGFGGGGNRSGGGRPQGGGGHRNGGRPQGGGHRNGPRPESGRPQGSGGQHREGGKPQGNRGQDPGGRPQSNGHAPSGGQQREGGGRPNPPATPQ